MTKEPTQTEAKPPAFPHSSAIYASLREHCHGCINELQPHATDPTDSALELDQFQQLAFSLGVVMGCLHGPAKTEAAKDAEIERTKHE